MKLIDEWPLSWRFWSVRLNALGSFLLSAMLAWPEFVLGLWNMLPVQISDRLPPRAALAIPLFLFIAATIARLVKQEKLNGKAARLRARQAR